MFDEKNKVFFVIINKVFLNLQNKKRRNFKEFFKTESQVEKGNPTHLFCLAFLYYIIMEIEEWRKIEGFEDYQISNLGNVKSLKFGKSFLMKTSADGHGYLRVKLCYKGNVKTKKIHKLVAIAFLNHKPDGTQKLVVDHINDIKTDNRVENLQIVTNRFNAYKTQGKYTSDFKGVSWYKQTKKWVTSIVINGKKIALGYYKTEEEASQAYQNKLKEIEL